MSQPQTPPTVGEIVEALLKLDQSLPLVVSTHYDNDVAHSSDVELTLELISPIGEKSFWDTQDPSSPAAGSIMAAVLTGGMY
jgi:hypothetical protein